MIRLLLTLIVLYVFVSGVSDLEPDQGDDVPVVLPARTEGPFRTDDDAQRCGAILGRALRCDLPGRDRAPLIDYCTAGLRTASGEVNHRLYEAFLEGARDGHRNAHGWSCARITRTLASPPLSGAPAIQN